jgi:uncharacterized protein YbaR (Trm112 family)
VSAARAPDGQPAGAGPGALDEGAGLERLRAAIRAALGRRPDVAGCDVQPALTGVGAVLDGVPAERRAALVARMAELVELNVGGMYEGVNAPRGTSPDRAQVLDRIRTLYEGRRSRHLEMGVHVGFPDARVRALAAESGFGAFIRLDLDPAVRPDVVADCARLPFADGSLDSVRSDSLFEHMRRPEQTIRESYRVLAPGGVMQVNTPFFFTLHDFPGDYMRLTPQYFEETCREAGFDEVYCHVYDFGGLYYTLQNASKQVTVNEAVPEPLRSAARALHANVMTLLMLASAFDEYFHGHARNFFIGVYCVAFKAGRLQPRVPPAASAPVALDDVLPYLVCPVTRQPLSRGADGRWLVTPDGTRRYPIEDGIPVLVDRHAHVAASEGRPPSWRGLAGRVWRRWRR